MGNEDCKCNLSHSMQTNPKKLSYKLSLYPKLKSKWCPTWNLPITKSHTLNHLFLHRILQLWSSNTNTGDPRLNKQGGPTMYVTRGAGACYLLIFEFVRSGLRPLLCTTWYALLNREKVSLLGMLHACSIPYYCKSQKIILFQTFWKCSAKINFTLLILSYINYIKKFFSHLAL